jgi:hypothetical protein
VKGVEICLFSDVLGGSIYRDSLKIMKFCHTVTAYGGELPGWHGNGIAGWEKERIHLCPIDIKGRIDVLADFFYRPDLV